MHGCSIFFSDTFAVTSHVASGGTVVSDYVVLNETLPVRPNLQIGRSSLRLFPRRVSLERLSTTAPKAFRMRWAGKNGDDSWTHDSAAGG